jgi:FSR family fosmidomycin resistance protein-like MFS transporter
MNKNYIRLIGAGHLVTDIYQGALPAMLPFLITDKHISYAAAALLIFASNASSLIIQPLFGIYSDKFSSNWALPVGLSLGGICLGLTGITSNYSTILILVALSGIGIALYHPEGGRLINKFSGQNKTSAISIFAAGGNIGFAVGPIITTAALLIFGLNGTLILCIPSVIMGIILFTQLKNFSKAKDNNTLKSKVLAENIIHPKDEWKPFCRLTATLLCRSIIFFGLNTFLSLYWINVLKQSELQGSIALSCLIVTGAIGTLFAGRFADKFGNKKIILVGYSCLLPLLLLFLLFNNPTLELIILFPLGIALYSPYSPMVALGQKYLPNHVGLASGITMGLGVTMGGIVSPLLGLISDNFGIHTALSSLLIVPIFALILARKLPVPNSEINVDDEAGALNLELSN